MVNLKIPVSNEQFFIDKLKNSRSPFSRSLTDFEIQGSVPPSRILGETRCHPNHYDLVPQLKVEGVLEYVRVIDHSHGCQGIVLKLCNSEHESRFFMLHNEFGKMLMNVVMTNGRVSGKFEIIKFGHAFSLRYLGELQ